MTWYLFDLIALALVFGPILLLGVPAILAFVRQPRELGLRPVPREEWSPAVRDHFDRIDRELDDLGYDPFATLNASRLPATNLARVYRRADRATLVFATVLHQRTFDEHVAKHWVEFCTVFGDGSVLAVRNIDLGNLLEAPPPSMARTFPGLTDLAALEAHHDRIAAELGAVPRVTIADEAELITEYEALNERSLRSHEAAGLLRFDPVRDCYRATVKLAWRGIRNYLDPYSDEFNQARFLLALAVGLGLPAAVLPWLGQLAAVDSWGFLAAAVLVFAGASALLGLVLEGKAWLWAFLLASLGSRLTLPAVFFTAWSPWLLLGLFATAGFPAAAVCNWQGRRRGRSWVGAEMDGAPIGVPSDART